MKGSAHYPEQHSLGLSVFLNLFPGAVLLLGFVILAPHMARLGFLQNGNDLLFSESFFHVHRPLW